MKLILFAFVLFTAQLINAQSFVLTPTDFFQSTNDSNTFVVDKVYAKNISGAAIDLSFEVIENTAVLNGWSQVMCAGPLCYPSIPATGSLGNIAAGDSVYCQLTTGFSNQVGTGDFLIRIFDEANPADGDTALFRYESVSTVGIEEATMMESKLYPNPTSGLLTVEFSSNEPVNIKVYSVAGELLLEKNQHTSASQLDLAALNSGLYMVVGASKNGSFVSTIIKK